MNRIYFILDIEKHVREYKPDIIISAGIGIQKPERIRLLSGLSVNMAIVGTKILERLNTGQENMVEYINQLHEATLPAKMSEAK